MTGPAVLLFCLLFPTFMAWLYFVKLAAPPDAPGQAARPSRVVQALYAGGKVVQFGLPLAWVYWATPGRLDWPYFDAAGLGVGLLFGVAVYALIVGMYFGPLRESATFAGLRGRVRGKLNEFGVASPVGFAVMAVFLSLVHSALEEYYWRWFVHAELRGALGPVAAPVISGLGFAAHHAVILWFYFPGRWASAIVPFTLGVAVGGAFWGWLYDTSGSLWGPWAGHVLADLALMTIAFDLVFRKGRNDPG